MGLIASEGRFRMSWKFVLVIWSCFHKGLEWFKDGMSPPSHRLHRPHLCRLGLGDGDEADPHHLGVISRLRLALAESVHEVGDLTVDLLTFLTLPHPRA